MLRTAATFSPFLGCCVCSYYVYGDSVNSAFRVIDQHLWNIIFPGKDKQVQADAISNYYETGVTSFVEFNANSLWFFAYCGCEVCSRYALVSRGSTAR